MHCSHVAPTSLQEIVPEDSVAFNWAKSYPVVIWLIAVNELAPLAIYSWIKGRKVGATAGNIVSLDVSEKRADTISTLRSYGMSCIAEPIRMEIVSLCGTILYQLYSLDVRAGDIKALKF